jgi:hypothetical protein
MRGSSTLTNAVRYHRPMRILPASRLQRRAIQISATPTAESPIIAGDVINSSIDPSLDPAGRPSMIFSFINMLKLLDARFEVLGAPYSLLSVSLSASQKLFTRKGTLVGVGGKAENVSCHIHKLLCL